MTPDERAALIADVALACIDSINRDAARPRRRWVGRTAQIREIAQDDRITSRARHTQRALIDEVMLRYSVTYSNAKKMISKARELLTTNN